MKDVGQVVNGSGITWIYLLYDLFKKRDGLVKVSQLLMHYSQVYHCTHTLRIESDPLLQRGESLVVVLHLKLSKAYVTPVAIYGASFPTLALDCYCLLVQVYAALVVFKYKGHSCCLLLYWKETLIFR